MFKKRLQEKVANDLIGKWLKNIELKEDEVNSALIMFSENDRTILLVTALSVKEDKLFVNRVINSVDINDAL